MLFSLGRRIVYERETRTRKLTPKPDALSQWRTMKVQRNHVSWLEIFKFKRDGVLPVESRRAGGVLGPVPQKDPPLTTGGPRPNARSQALETEGKCDWPKKPQS